MLLGTLLTILIIAALVSLLYQSTVGLVPGGLFAVLAIILLIVLLR